MTHHDPVPQTQAEMEIRRRIADQGSITFAEFMETALYHPEDGYYTTRWAVGAEGDYFTSPSAHPVFSALLALQLERMWHAMGRPSPFRVVEMGSGNGLMSGDLMDYVGRLRSGFEKALEYIATDRVTQTETPTGIVGCVISNELVDAFPVHRFRIERKAVREVFVTLDPAGGLVEELGEPSTPLIERRLDGLSAPLPEGASGEVNLGIGPWMAEVARILDRGFVVTIDYGREAEQLYSASRPGGALQTYFRHTGGGSPYQRIGRQDITAHVDFSALVYEGRAAGLSPVTLLSQAEHLKNLGIRQMERKIRRMGLDDQSLEANLMALRELVRPTGLGGFLVLVQRKGVGVRSYEELLPDPSRICNLDPPALRDDHTPLYAGRYPEHLPDLDNLWPTRNP